jgi:hypothetical protein
MPEHYTAMEPSASSTTGPFFPDLNAIFGHVNAAGGGQHLQPASPFATQRLAPLDVRAEIERQLQRTLFQMHALTALHAGTSTDPPSALFQSESPMTCPAPMLPVLSARSTVTHTLDSGATTQTAIAALSENSQSLGLSFDPLQRLQAAMSLQHTGSTSCAPDATTLVATHRSRSAEIIDAEARGNSIVTGSTTLASAAREALAQVYAARTAPAKSKAHGSKWQRETKNRKADSSGLQLCKVCESRKLPQHFYNRHKTCKDCQCQINRIARSQHCSRDEAKRQVNASAFAARHGFGSVSATEEAAENGPGGGLQSAIHLGSGNLGAASVATSMLVHSSPLGEARQSDSPKLSRDASRSPDQLRLLTEVGDEAAQEAAGNRMSRTGLPCGIDALADVACAILEGYDPTEDEPQAKRGKFM